MNNDRFARHSSGWVFRLIAAMLAAYYLYRTVIVPLPSLGPAISDFWWYHQAAQAILDGKSPFSVEDFAYPPLLAFLLTPLAMVSYEVARWAWFALSHLFLFCAGYLVWRAAGCDRPALLSVLVVWACGGAIAESLMLGQINPLLLVLVALSWCPWRGEKSAAVAALAGALKLWPATLLAAYALLRQWRAFAVGAALFALLVVLPVLATAGLLSPPALPPATYYWMGTPALFNFSLPAVVLRILDPPAGNGRLPHNWEFGNNVHELNVALPHLWIAVAVSVCLLAVGLALLAHACARGPVNPKETRLPLVSAALVSLALAASPVCWSHYQLLQYPGAALLLAAFLRNRLYAHAAVLAALFLGVYQIPILGLGPYLAAHGWTAANMPVLWLLTSVTPLCSLGLFAFYLRELHTGWRNEPASPH